MAERHLVGVAFDDIDIVNRDAEMIGRDLSVSDLVTLPMAMRAHKQRDLCATVDPDRCGFIAAVELIRRAEKPAGPEAGPVQKRGRANSHQHTLFTQPLLLLAEF